MRLVLFAALAMLPCAAQQAQKIAVIDGQAALAGTQEGKQALARWKSKIDSKNKEFETRQNEIAQLEDQLNKGAPVMTSDKKQQLAITLNEKKKRLQRDSQDAQEENERDQQQVVQPLEERLGKVIDKYAADNGYALVIDYSVPGNAVRYRAAGIDITKEVVALYDRTYGAGKP